MSEILRQWLLSRLGLIVDYNLQSFEDIAQDGTLIAQILHNYGLIKNENLEKVNTTTDVDVALSNLLYLRYWLTLIGVNCTEKCLFNIAHKEKSAAVRLFYQLYVILNTKSKVTYLISKNMEDILQPKPVEISVDKTYNACEINEIAVSPYISETRTILKWHRDKYMDLMQKCKRVRKEYMDNLDKKIRIAEDLRRKEFKTPKKLDKRSVHLYRPEKKLKNFVVNKPNITLILDEKGRCIENKKQAKLYINYLKEKQQKLDAHKKIEHQIHKLLLEEIIDSFVEKEDKEFKEIIASKLLKQSCYEKQLSVKLMEIRYQKHLMLENLQNENKLLLHKKEQEFIDQLFQQHSNLTLKEKRYIQNKKRQFELHRRLWAEKCAMKHTRNKIHCKEIVNDLIDLAVKSVEYRQKYKTNIPNGIWREWTALFVTNQPIFEIIKDVSQVTEEVEDFDEPLTLELYRQNGLDEIDFQDYKNINTVWNIELAQLYYEQNREEIDLASNILGFIVHRLLLIKYPNNAPPVKPVLPPTDYRASILGLETHEILPILQKSLIAKEIIVIEMQTIINDCLVTYLQECVVDIDIPLKKETEKGGKPKKEPTKLIKKPANKKGTSIIVSESKKLLAPLELATTETQTPKMFPEEEIKFSNKAELGKFAYETLNLGLQINENLMTAMVVEHLKHLTHVKGWVLINFPATVNEAYMLEEVLNGIKIPPNYITHPEDSCDITNIQNRDEIFVTATDRYGEIRKSLLLPDPKPAQEDKYISFFTSFISMQFQSDNIEEELEESTSALIEFYDRLGVNNSFNYNKIDFNTIKDLIVYISKDDVYASQIYDELVHSAVARSVKETKKKNEELAAEKSKSVKGNLKATSKTKAGKSAVSMLEKSNIELEEIPVPPKPGEDNWEYITLPISRDLARLLATSWQSIEDIYINDFKQVLFIKRIYQNQIIPYVHAIDTYMQNYIERPDIKQQYLHSYQNIYNDISTDLREDDEFKAELHFRLSQFRDNLWFICDDRMKECEEERIRIINENWFTYHSSMVTNLYTKACQLEINRCVNTIQLLQDYYSTLGTKKPQETKLPKFVLQKFEMSAWSSTQIRKSSANNYDRTPILIANMLTDTTLTTENSPFVVFLNASYKSAMAYLGTLESAYLAGIKVIESALVVKPVKTIKPTKVKLEVTLTPGDIMVSENTERMFMEWNAACAGEIIRTRFRLRLILEKATTDLNENLYYAEKLFHDIYNRIQERYNEEVENVDNVCQIFARAIEACEPIKVRLVLDGATFRIDQNMLFLPDEAFTYKTVKERHGNFNLTLGQLEYLINVFLNLAPSGSMSERNFIFVLQDMVATNPEECSIRPLPLLWHNLKDSHVIKLISDLYGSSEYIDWKDFIFWNLLLPYPTEYELLEVRRQFREMDRDVTESVNFQQFSCVQFWFEEEFYAENEIIRMNFIKELLCKMFQNDKDEINYSAMLLYFCKDVDSVRGVAKAFELSIGQLVCWDVDLGVKFVQVVQCQKELEEQKKREILSAVNSVVESIFEKTMGLGHTGSSTTFLDIDEQPLVTSPRSSRTNSCICPVAEEVDDEEQASSELPSLCYYLTFPVLLKVMTAAYPWHSCVPCHAGTSFRDHLEFIYKSCQREEFDNIVFIHEFINNDFFLELIEKNSKFVERLPPEIVRGYVEVCTCEKLE